jgi:hypothetical protein
MLKPQDIAVTLKLLLKAGGEPPTFAQLAAEMRLSVSEVHAAVKRAALAGLLVSRDDSDVGRRRWQPVKSALREFLVSGLRYVWPVRRGAAARGVPTGASLPEVSEKLGLTPPAVPIVWPDPEGEVRGETLKPLYPKALHAAKLDAALHEWLALLDLLRAGSGRETTLAGAEVHKRLS